MTEITIKQLRKILHRIEPFSRDEILHNSNKLMNEIINLNNQKQEKKEKVVFT